MKLRYFSLLMVVFIIYSCKKDKEAETETPKCVAGTGGQVTIVAFPKHHGKSVRPYSIYVKFNSKELPGISPASFDLTITADTTEDHIEVKNLKCGDYYIYMNGYDTSAKESVKGGIPYSIIESATGELAIDIPVTE